MNKIIGIILFLIPMYVFSNTSEIDSLTNILKNITEDNELKVDYLNTISSKLIGIENKQAGELCNEAYTISQNLQYKKGLADALNIKGSLSKNQGEYNKAISFYNEAIKTREKYNLKQNASLYNNLGLVYKDLNRYDKSLEYFNLAHNHFKNNSDSNSVATTLSYIGGLYWKQRNYDFSLIYYLKALDIREQLKDKRKLAKALNNIGMVYKDHSNYELAINSYTDAQKILSDIGDMQGLAESLNNLGGVYWKIGDYGKAMDLYLESLDIRESIGNKKQISGSYSNIGNIYKSIDNLNKALEYYKLALDLRIETGDKALIASSYNDIGSIYRMMNSYDEAINFYTKAEEIRKNLRNKLTLAGTLKNMGLVYRDKKDYLTAIQYYQRALKLFAQSNDKKDMALILNYLGDVYQNEKRFDEAFESYKQAFDINSDNDYKAGLIMSSLKLSDYYFEKNNSSTTLKYLNIALSNANKTRIKIYLKDIYIRFYHYYKKKEDYKKAVNYYVKYTEINNSILEDAGNKKIADAHVHFITEKNAKELELLEKERKFDLLKKERELEKQKIIIYISIVGLLIITIFLIIILRHLREKKKANSVLETQKKEIQNQANKLEKVNEQLSLKNNQITDSIVYAQTIQSAVLPSRDQMSKHLEEFFIMYRPKDIVSGDFYWFSAREEKVYVAVSDCTGHGVPGAFMSMIGNTLLNQIVHVKRTSNPAEILNELNNGIFFALGQSEENIDSQSDGMDISLLVYDKATKKINIALANHTAIIIKGNEIEMLRGDNCSIGDILTRKIENHSFTQIEVPFENEVKIYMFSDGFQDQFGGQKFKKYMISGLKRLLFENRNKPFIEQKEKLEETFDDWKGDKKQIDDVLIAGIKFTK